MAADFHACLRVTEFFNERFGLVTILRDHFKKDVLPTVQNLSLAMKSILEGCRDSICQSQEAVTFDYMYNVTKCRTVCRIAGGSGLPPTHSS